MFCGSILDNNKQKQNLWSHFIFPFLFPVHIFNLSCSLNSSEDEKNDIKTCSGDFTGHLAFL